MNHHVNRRYFLKAVPAASALAYAGSFAREAASAAPPATVQISATPYRPVADYPIQPKRHWDVVLKDTFWKPKVTANADVTIPFEVRKLTEGGRGLSGNVLEAAMLSLRAYPNPEIQT